MDSLLLTTSLFLFDKSIFNTKKKLQVFEEKTGMRSEDFFDKFDKGLAGDDQASTPRAIFKAAIKNSASSIILYDPVIIGNGEWWSWKEE